VKSVCLVCLSVLAVEGRMLNVTDEDAKWTIINVAVSNVIHETTHFADLVTSIPRDPDVQTYGPGRSRTHELILPLRTPAVCRVHYGDGLFVFVGRIRLKRTLHVQCAPRLEEFRRVWSTAVQRQLQPCHLPVT